MVILFAQLEMLVLKQSRNIFLSRASIYASLPFGVSKAVYLTSTPLKTRWFYDTEDKNEFPFGKEKIIALNLLSVKS
jgi:hypothetical protein